MNKNNEAHIVRDGVLVQLLECEFCGELQEDVYYDEDLDAGICDGCSTGRKALRNAIAEYLEHQVPPEAAEGTAFSAALQEAIDKVTEVADTLREDYEAFVAADSKIGRAGRGF